MISFHMVLVNPYSEVRENYHNKKTLWSHKLTKDTYASKQMRWREPRSLAQGLSRPRLQVSLDRSFTSLGSGPASIKWGLEDPSSPH